MTSSDSLALSDIIFNYFIIINMTLVSSIFLSSSLLTNHNYHDLNVSQNHDLTKRAEINKDLLRK
jgi:hypothetical protein